MVKKCIICDKQFVTYPSKILLGRGKYCSKVCCLSVTSKNILLSTATRFKKGQNAWNRKEFILTRGSSNRKLYKLIYCPDHPACTKKGYVREHRLVMEKQLGRYLSANEIVHHIDGNTLNNDVHNLQVMTKAEHDSLKHNSPLVTTNL